jgi:hypothetical protein
MSDEPPYGYIDCGYPNCTGKMPLHFDPADFTFSRICRSCRIKRQTHRFEPFCTHGHVLPSFSSVPPLDCGCTVENSIDDAAWDWVEKPKAA